jgi:hypothetical protein
VISCCENVQDVFLGDETVVQVEDSANDDEAVFDLWVAAIAKVSSMGLVGRCLITLASWALTLPWCSLISLTLEGCR